MKCKYCNANVEQDAQFCPNCGKDFSKLKKCVKCGELLDKDTLFCPHCGTEQPRKKRPVEKKTSSKKWLWVVIGLFLLGAIGAGIFFYSGNNMELSEDGNASVETVQTVSNSVTAKSTEADPVAAKEFIESMYKDFFENKNFDTEKLTNLHKYLSPSVTEELKMECPYDGGEGDSSYIVDFFCDGTLNYERPDYGDKVVSRTIEKKNDGWFLVTNIWDVIKEPVKVRLQVKSVNGTYKIVDIGIDEEENSNVPVVNEGTSSDAYTGKVYKGSGNGGGLYTEMTITFHDNHQCTCVSDWYRAYSSPKMIKGHYEVKDNLVIVDCKDGDIEHHFEFEIKSNGRTLSFDHSDPDMGGTMGNDYMSLEIQ